MFSFGVAVLGSHSSKNDQPDEVFRPLSLIRKCNHIKINNVLIKQISIQSFELYYELTFSYSLINLEKDFRKVKKLVFLLLRFSSIQKYSYTQLNFETVLFQIIQFGIQKQSYFKQFSLA